MNQSFGVIRVETHVVIVFVTDTTHGKFLVESIVVDLNEESQ